MWGMLICVFLVNLSSSQLIIRNQYRKIRAESTDYPIICSVQSIDVYDPRSEFNQLQRAFTTSWKHMVKKPDDSDESDENDSEENNDHSTSSHNIQVTFNIPYSFSNRSILNETVLITDTEHNRLIESIIRICINGTSFLINYSTNKDLPHNVCLYLLLNLTGSLSLKEIYTCQVINKNSSDNHDTQTDQSLGPSAVFIIAQGVMSFLMMFFICIVHTVRKKHVTTCVNQHLFQKKRVSFKNKVNIIEPDASTENSLPLEDRVLSAVDLTSIRNDRRYTNHSLIDIKEFTKKISLSSKESENHHL